MLTKIITFSLSKRYSILTLSLVLMIAGIISWLNLQIVAYPDIADTEVVVIAKLNGIAAEEMELLVTIPLERAVNSVPKVLNRRSRTVFGLSILKLTFEESVDDYFARQRVLEAISNVNLPPGVDVSLGPLSTPVGELIRYVLEGDDTYDVMKLRELQDWVVSPKILQASGVADITTFGGLVRQFNVIIRPVYLEKYKLTIKDISTKIIANNSSTGANIIVSGVSQLAIRSAGRISSIADIENIVLSANNGIPILVKDVATVEIGALAPSGVLGYNDNVNKVDVDDSVEGIVLMRRGQNPSEVISNIKESIDTLNNSILPRGVKIRILYDRNDLVTYTLTTVGHTLIEGVTIIIIVLIFFLGNIRAAMSVAITIPLSLLFAFICMKMTGIPANLLSLGAIDFGIIVDASVVIIDAIMRSLVKESKLDELKVLQKITIAIGSVQKEIFFSVTIIILAFVPLFTLQRVEGKLFSPMAYTLSYAVCGSLFLAFTLVPVLCSFFFAKKITVWHNPILTWLESKYKSILLGYVESPKKILTISLVAIICTLFLATRIGIEFIPELDEGGFNIRCILPTGISLKEARQYPKIIREEIAKFSEVKFSISQLGRNDDGTDPYGPNRIEVLVQLKDYKTWDSDKTKKDVLKGIKSNLEERLPGVLFSFSQPIIDSVAESITGSASDLAIVLSGTNLVELREYAKNIYYKVVKDAKGTSEAGFEQEGPQSQLLIKIKRDVAARYNINVEDVSSLLELAIGGRSISSLYEGERYFDITLRFTAENRDNPHEIGNLLVISPNGSKIPLSQVADIIMVEGETTIARENGKRQIGVRTNIRDIDQGSYVSVAKAKFKKEIQLPEHISVKWGGQFENLTRAQKRLMLVLPITIILIFFVLFILFQQEAKYAAVVLSNILFALIGAIILLFVRGIYFSVSGGVGFICLFGISIMSGVLLISCIHHLRTDLKLSLRDAVIQGTTTQFRMNVMTMTMALIGLIPAALATGIGSDIQRPLATVIVGGLLSNLILSLFALPIIYYIMEKRAIKKNGGIDPILNYYIDPVLMTHIDLPYHADESDNNTVVKKINRSQSQNKKKKNNSE